MPSAFYFLYSRPLLVVSSISFPFDFCVKFESAKK